jgi:hypothetical protein
VAGADLSCPACEGRVRCREICPACLGDGHINHTRQRGIAVFPAREGLYRYLAEKGAEVSGKAVLELDGSLSGERDLDADAAALFFSNRAGSSRFSLLTSTWSKRSALGGSRAYPS